MKRRARSADLSFLGGGCCIWCYRNTVWGGCCSGVTVVCVAALVECGGEAGKGETIDEVSELLNWHWWRAVEGKWCFDV